MRSLLSGTLLGALLSLPAAAAPVEWEIGMTLHAFITKATSCPESLDLAVKDKQHFQIFSLDGKVLAGGPLPEGAIDRFELANGFTTGTNIGRGRRKATSTGIRNAQSQTKAGADCWSGSGAESSTGAAGLTIEPCARDVPDSQTFWVESWSALDPGPFPVYVHGSGQLAVPASPGDALGWGQGGKGSGVCFYDADTGSAVASSMMREKDPYYPPDSAQPAPGADSPPPSPDDKSALATPKKPQNQLPLIALPQCRGDGFSYDPRTMDCLVARTANTIPPACTGDKMPRTRECVLHLLPAFCADLRKSGDFEACLQSVAQGPCVANEGGAACRLEDLFADITFRSDPVVPSGSPSTSRMPGPTGRPSPSGLPQERRRVGARGAVGLVGQMVRPRVVWKSTRVFADEIDAESATEREAEEEFWKAFARSLGEMPGEAWGSFTAGLRDFQLTLCQGLTLSVPEMAGELGASIWQGCETLWGDPSVQETPLLTYEDDAQRTSAVASGVVQVIAPVPDTMSAASVLAGGAYTNSVIRRFAPKRVKGGSVLQAVNKDAKDPKDTVNSVHIYRMGADGKPRVFQSADEEQVALNDLENNGFLHCDRVATIEEQNLEKRQQPTGGGDDGLNLDLNLGPNGLVWDMPTWADNMDEDQVVPSLPQDAGSSSAMQTDWEYTVPDPVQLKTKDAPSLTQPEKRMLRKLRKYYDDSTNRDVPQVPPLFANDQLNNFRKKKEEAKDMKQRKALVREFARAFGLYQTEVTALQAWAEWYEIYPNTLRDAFRKIEPFEGTVRRFTCLDDATSSMLEKFEAGIVSKGDKGIYEIRDLVTNTQSMRLGHSGVPPRKLLSATAGFQRLHTWYGGDKLFVIQSTRGTYISPGVEGKVDTDGERELYEVAFLDGVSGRLKLLGYDGFELNGKLVPHVYYFQNVAAKRTPANPNPAPAPAA